MVGNTEVGKILTSSSGLPVNRPQSAVGSALQQGLDEGRPYVAEIERMQPEVVCQFF